MNKTSYNQIAGQWAVVRDNSFVSELIVDFARKLKPNAEVLDIGCGTGYPIAKFLSDQGLNITGIDASEEMISLAKSHQIENSQFFVTDFFNFTSEKQYDGIIAWDSLFHFPKNKQAEIYPLIYKLLKPGGYFLFTHGKRDGEHQDKMMGHPFYYSALSKDHVCEILTELGFMIRYVHEDFMERGSHRELVVFTTKPGSTAPR